MDLYLRNVTPEDVDLLFEWANDSVVRQNAFHTEKIQYNEHVNWFEKMMNSEDVICYIFCHGGEPIGQVRLNIDGGTGCISYSIAASKRGCGLGSKMLILLKEKVLNEITYIDKLIGRVKYQNKASARVFKKCGYQQLEKKDYIEFVLELSR